jgi:hypothetical protein
MEHPLRNEKYKALRKRVLDILREGFSIQRKSNIIFVCGGNDNNHMRRQFQAKFSSLLPTFEFFEPEFAMKSYFTLGDDIPFDISEFEELVGELSHSIVIFPEAPGSFAEVGYFSAIPKLARKIILAIDLNWQHSDSFISLGPAKKIADISIFQPNIQLDYKNPDFSLISQKIQERSPLKKTKESFSIKEFASTNTFELFSLIYQIVYFLKIANTGDIEFFMQALYRGHYNSSKIKKIISILVGSKRLTEIGEYEHLRTDDKSPVFLSIKDGFRTTQDVLSLDISTAFLSADPEFQTILEEN